jgi:hypothetical protein
MPERSRRKFFPLLSSPDHRRRHVVPEAESASDDLPRAVGAKKDLKKRKLAMLLSGSDRDHLSSGLRLGPLGMVASPHS